MNSTPLGDERSGAAVPSQPFLDDQLRRTTAPRIGPIALTALATGRSLFSMWERADHLAELWRARSLLSQMRWSLLDRWKGRAVTSTRLHYTLSEQLRADTEAAMIHGAATERHFESLKSATAWFDELILIVRGSQADLSTMTDQVRRPSGRFEELIEGRDRLIAGSVDNGSSLHVGVGKGRDIESWDGAVEPPADLGRAVQSSLVKMRAVAGALGISKQVTVDEDVTWDALSREVRSTVVDLRPGMVFLLTFNGHGVRHGNRASLVLQDHLLAGEELLELLTATPAGVRICIVVDACHAEGIWPRKEGKEKELELPQGLEFDILNAAKLGETTEYRDTKGGFFTDALHYSFCRQTAHPPDASFLTQEATERMGQAPGFFHFHHPNRPFWMEDA